ncbi:MAG: hypothetical protein ACKO6Q_05295, partial [Bacteroidota bacterium]
GASASQRIECILVLYQNFTRAWNSTLPTFSLLDNPCASPPMKPTSSSSNPSKIVSTSFSSAISHQQP